MKIEFDYLPEALELGFDAWANGATEFGIDARIAHFDDGTSEIRFTLWADYPLQPTSPNWENSFESFLCR